MRHVEEKPSCPCSQASVPRRAIRTVQSVSSVTPPRRDHKSRTRGRTPRPRLRCRLRHVRPRLGSALDPSRASRLPSDTQVQHRDAQLESGCARVSNRHATAMTIRPNSIVVAKRNGTAISRSPKARKRAPKNAETTAAFVRARMIEAIDACTHLSMPNDGSCLMAAIMLSVALSISAACSGLAYRRFVGEGSSIIRPSLPHLGKPQRPK